MISLHSKWPKVSCILLLGAVGGLAAWIRIAHAGTVPPRPPPKPLESTAAFATYRRDIQPLLNREIDEESCVSCHDENGKSQLILDGDPVKDFRALLEGGYFFTEGPDTLLARVTTDNLKMRMPKGKHAIPWTDQEKELLQNFLNELDKVVKVTGRADEHFPAMLRRPFVGDLPQSQDNQFITYRQLRGKIRTIFQDDWVRNGVDKFQENIALFGGADFKERFNESSKASASFLSGLDMLSRDVADRAYTLKTGPFADRSESLPDAATMTKPDATYRREIGRLYEAILFRAPTDDEAQEAFDLIRGVYQAKEQILNSDFQLSFDLSVEDPATHLKSQRTLVLPVSGEYHGLYQELVDESQHAGSGNIERHPLARKFHFKKGDNGQRFRLSNVNTFANVSLAGIELHKVAAPTPALSLPITAPGVQAEGAWKVTGEGANTSYEDNNTEKGGSNVVIPIQVEESGEYELTVLWRLNAANAHNVLVEVFSQDGNTLAADPAPAKLPPGEAHFYYDSSADNIPHVELPAVFRFGENDFVEINNTGTHDRVSASALGFVPDKGGEGFLVDTPEAEGHEKWTPFNFNKFKPYNKVGAGLNDNGGDKGQLYLRYKPSLKKDNSNGWKPDSFYRVQINFPGKAGNDQRVPVIVHSSESAPILQVSAPARARAESDVVIDASGSYTTQGSKLVYEWRQIDGPKVDIDKAGAVLRFKAPRRSLHQAAWVALCRALMRHPDFFFTRPPSMDRAHDDEERKKLQLVKLAMDLVARTPTPAEFAEAAGGAAWETMVDRYLDSQEFRDFYFHRIRLYLESHGTEIQDEPARLWCYIAFNDLPMQQILTADYTVDKDFKKQPRPAYHGHTGVLTMKGFIEGKPGLPHYNYAAQVAMLFLGYIFEVPPEVVEQRQGSTAASTVDPNGICYSCHKVLTPLAMQRNRWLDDGRYRTHDEYGLPIEASDEGLVEGYPFAGEGLEAFATQAVKKERFVRTIVDTHVTFFFGRQMRWHDDERHLYLHIWEQLQRNHYTLRSLMRALLTSPEYVEGKATTPAAPAKQVTSSSTAPPKHE